MAPKNRFSIYDQAVLDDPAYETKPGPVSGFISDVVYGALTPEQELLQQIDQSKQLRSEATAKALQGTKYESFAGQSDLPSYVIQSPGIKERLDEAGFKFEPFQEGFGRIGQFIFGGQRKAFKKLSEGEKLTQDDINEIAFAPLDALDFIFPPLIIKKLARLGIKSVDDVIKSTIKDPDIDLIKERIGGGSGIPLGMRGTDDPLGIGDRTVLAPDRNGVGGGSGGARLTKEGVQSREDNTQKLIDILKQDLDQNKTKSIGQIIKDNNLEGLLKTERGKGQELKKEVRQKIVAEVPDIYKSKFTIRAESAASAKRADTDPKLKEFLLGQIEEGNTFNSLYALGNRLSVLKVGSRKALLNRLEDPQFKDLINQLVVKPETGARSTDVFSKVYSKIPKERIAEFTGVNEIKNFDVENFNRIKELRISQGITGDFSPSDLFKDFLEFRYRNVKDSGQFPKLTPQQFFKRKYDPEEITKMRSEFQNFINLEADRLTMQKDTREFLEELGNIPEYKKYLLDSKGQLDLKLVKVDKAHDTPLFVTRVEGKGRLKNVGRFLDQGTEPEFINPSFQAYNNLQVKLDPTINKLADLRVNTTLQNKASNMPFSLTTKNKNKSGEYIIPKDRLDFVSEDLVGLLNQKGANIDLASFEGKTQLEFLTAIDKAIDNIYKNRAIRTIVPVREGKGGKKVSELFGVADMKAIPNDVRVALFKKAMKDQLDYAVENNIPVDVFKNEAGYIKGLKRGGVQMAIGGQNFTENMNQQQFTPDPAIEGESAFKQAVESGNLTALNLPKIFKGLGEAFGVYTPKKVVDTPAAPRVIDKSDFPLQSFTLEKIQSSQTNQAKPQDWINELQGGKNVAPTSELLDSGLFQYLADYEKYFPGQRISKAKLLQVLEENPISNLKVRVKGEETGDPAYDSYMGRPRHRNAGNARIDEAAKDYREVIIEAGTLPGQKSGEEFVNSTHFAEKNVLAFGRVGTYKNSQGDNVAVIQEMQTDYLTQVQNERERLEAQIKKLTNDKTKAEERLAANPESYDVERNQNIIKEADSKLPALLKLQESNLIKPYPNIAAQELIPGYNKQLQDLQKQINDLSMQGVRRENPEFLMQINRLEGEQKQVLEALLDLNRASGYDLLAKDIQVPDISQRDDLINYSEGLNNYVSMKPIKTFAPTPLNKQTDYVDAIIKAVIKDAEDRDINKITIMPADIGPNTRWGKDSEEAKKKFRNLYDKVGIQTLRNIAKKYGGEVNVEQIIDTTKANKGAKFLNKNVDGEFELLRDLEVRAGLTPEDVDDFLSTEIERIARDYGSNEVVLRREIAPGQTMEYFVQTKTDDGFELIPLREGERAEDATIIIDEYNPSVVDMFVLTLPETNKQAPMYLFKKKKGGIMGDDRLVSITDIYGDY
jgi:hypothetical protein